MSYLERTPPREVLVPHERIFAACQQALALIDQFKPMLEQVAATIEVAERKEKQAAHDLAQEAQIREWEARRGGRLSSSERWMIQPHFYYRGATEWFFEHECKLRYLGKLSSVACAPITLAVDDALLIADIALGDWAKEADERFLALPEVPHGNS